jgi:hypothetical protein
MAKTITVSDKAQDRTANGKSRENKIKIASNPSLTPFGKDPLPPLPPKKTTKTKITNQMQFCRFFWFLTHLTVLFTISFLVSFYFFIFSSHTFILFFLKEASPRGGKGAS